jgi:hypothetical protein
MPLNKMGDFSFNHADQQDDLYKAKTSAEIKQDFDSRGEQLKVKLNDLIDKLQSIVDGDSGADNVKATAIDGLTGTTVQSLLESLKQVTDEQIHNLDNMLLDLDSLLYQTINNLNSTNTNITKVDQDSISRDNSHLNSLKAHKSENIEYSGSLVDQTNVKGALESIIERVNNIVSQSGTSNTEIVDARKPSQGAAYSTLKARLDNFDAGLAETITFENQTDFVDILQKNMKFTELTFKNFNGGSLPRSFEIILTHDKNKHITYRFDGNAYDDYIIFTDGYLGTLDGMNLYGNDFPFTSRTGTWNDTVPPNSYTTQVGATVQFDFYGTGFDFIHYTDSRGGVWEFVCDGDTSNKVQLSTWSSTAVSKVNSQIFRDLPRENHRVIATFKGDDPVNPPSSGVGTARGWMKYRAGATYDYPATRYDSFPTNTKVQQILYGLSNKDFALSVKPAGTALSSKFVPMHSSTGTAFKITNPELYVDGKLIGSDAFIGNAKEFKLVQRVYGKHPDYANNLLEITTIHTINLNGSVEITGKVKFLENTDISGYTAMMPIAYSFAQQCVTSIGNNYDATLQTGSTDLTDEKDKTQSFIFVNINMKDYACAMRINDIKNTLRQGKSNRYKDNNGSPIWLEHRGTTLQKIYPNVFKFHTAQANEVYKFGATYMIGNIKNIYDVI